MFSLIIKSCYVGTVHAEVMSKNIMLVPYLHHHQVKRALLLSLTENVCNLWNPTPHYFVLGSIMSSKGWLEVYYQALLREITGWVTPWKYTNYLLSKKKRLCLQSDASQCSTVSLLTFLQWLSMKSLMVCASTVSILGKRLTEPLFSPNNEVIIRSPVYVLCASNLCL